jgi:hypothetical protein
LREGDEESESLLLTMSNYSGLTMTMSPAFNGRKRRQPMDPPEENNIDLQQPFFYDSERNNAVHDHVSKRHRGDELNNNLQGVDADDDAATNAALLSFGSSSLSLNPPDPPANYGFSYPPSSLATDPLSNHNIIRRDRDAWPNKQEEQSTIAIAATVDGNTSLNNSPNIEDNMKIASTMIQRVPIDPTGSSSSGLLLMNTHNSNSNMDDVSMAGESSLDDDDKSEGIIDDDECNNSVGSAISESSIKSAMYQLVFGRWRPPSPLGIGGGTNSNGINIGGSGGSGSGTVVGRYDAVDSKIEDMIRRSRLEAVIRSNSKNGEDGKSRDQSPMSSRLSDVDMDDDDDDAIDNVGN